MSCPEHVTTLAWIAGEGPENHLHHVATCAPCQETLDTHERLAALSPVLRPVLARPALRARRVWPALGLAILALAAGLLLGLRATHLEAPPPPPARAGHDLDAALDDVSADLDALHPDPDGL